MKIFITGASGFIGMHLITRLLDEGHELIINERTKIKNLSSAVKTISLNEDDINSAIQFFKDESFDGLIHLASLYITNHKPEDVVNLINSNVRFSSFVLEAAAKTKIPWFINTGTFWQNYENRDYSPVNLYAATKQAFESIAQYYIETDQIKFVTLLLSDTYGTNDTRPKIFNLWERIAKTGEILNMSPGDQILDISYIDDVVNAFYILSQHLEFNSSVIKNGAVFAVKAETRYTLKKMASIFEQVSGCKLNIEWGKLPYREREVMIPYENGKAVPSWVPKISIEEGIKIIMNNQ